MMTRAMSPENPICQSRRGGVVIVAIGLHLLLCSIATAAGACGDSIDRSARRLPAQVAQALREMVDRSTRVSRPAPRATPGFRVGDCPERLLLCSTTHASDRGEQRWARRRLNLPPPARV